MKFLVAASNISRTEALLGTMGVKEPRKKSDFLCVVPFNQLWNCIRELV